MSSSPKAVRKILRPMRPNPLIPTLTAIPDSNLLCQCRTGCQPVPELLTHGTGRQPVLHDRSSLLACNSHTSAAVVVQCTSLSTADLLEKRNCKIMPARRQCQAGTLRSFLKPRTVC